MSVVTFKISKHSLRGCDIVEIMVDGHFVATVVPDENAPGFRIMSSHLDKIVIDDCMARVPQGIHAFTFITETV